MFYHSFDDLTRAPQIRYLDRTKSASDDYDRAGSGTDYDHFPSSISKTKTAEGEEKEEEGASEKVGGGSTEEGRVQSVVQLGKTATTSTGNDISSSTLAPSTPAATSMSTTVPIVGQSSSLKTESPPFVGSIDYGEAPPEPPQDDKDAIKVSVKFPWGKLVSD